MRARGMAVGTGGDGRVQERCERVRGLFVTFLTKNDVLTKKSGINEGNYES